MGIAISFCKEQQPSRTICRRSLARFLGAAIQLGE
jgi:hypothetical protein